MPLNRDHITASSRIMLHIYPLLALGLGLAYTLGDPARYESPSNRLLRDMMPIRAWGFVFLAMAAVMLAAWLTERRDVMIAALCLGFAFYTVWSVTFLVAAFTVPLAAATGPMVWGFVAVAHIASLQSLTKDSPL